MDLVSGPMPQPAPAVLCSWQEQDRSYHASEIGGKARGLLRLPRLWTPPFVILTSTFVASAREVGAARAYASLAEQDRAILVDLVDRAEGSNSSGALFTAIYVRSNAVEEDNTKARGRYNSTAVELEIEATFPIIDSLLSSAVDMRILLQVAVDGVGGFLSNERRVTERREHGVVEGLPGGANPARMVRSRGYDIGRPLSSTSIKSAEANLGAVLGWVHKNFDGYCNVEWIWDGHRLWIVQVDELENEKTDLAAARYLMHPSEIRSSRPRSISGATYFRDVDAAKWKKLWRASLFAELGLPTADIYLIEGATWLSGGGAGLISKILDASPGNWVIRTDVAASCSYDPDLLPTSDPTSDLSQLLVFMDRTASEFARQGLAPTQWAFIAAPFVPARISAMAYARPGGSDVQVDALWGFPDGLMHLPHDTFYYVGSDTVVEKQYKPACLLFDQGKWAMMQLGPPLDWAQTLSRTEVGAIANWALKVANHLGESVKLMVLARVAGTKGVRGCLPFHFTTGEIVPPARNSPKPKDGVLTMRSADDVADAASSAEIRGIAIQPDVDLMRDVDFLAGVARLAIDRGVPILFEGSLLAHAYHILRSTGAVVVPMKRTKYVGSSTSYQKLVRDAIPAIIERAGAVARVRSLSPSEALPLLKRKLVEEALEALSAETEGELIEELADVAEVFESLQYYIREGREVVRQVMLDKRERRGGFRDLVFLEAADRIPLGAVTDTARGAKSRTGGSARAGHSRRLVGDRNITHLSIPLIPPLEGSNRRESISLDAAHEVVVDVTYSTTAVTVSIVVADLSDNAGLLDELQPALFDLPTTRGEAEVV